MSAPVLSIKDQEDHTDKVVLEHLLQSRWPWSVEEVGRQLNNPLDAEDTVGRLCTEGLVHRMGGFVFPTRAAVRSADLDLGVGGHDDD
jgi:hypothetical protein